MKKYIEYIKKKYPEILNIEVKLLEYNIRFIPFDEETNIYEGSKVFFWWQAYNNLKHGRVLNKKDGNLKNTLYSLAGLYVLEMFWIKKLASENDFDIPDNESKIFELGESWSKYISMSKVVMETTDN